MKIKRLALTIMACSFFYMAEAQEKSMNEIFHTLKGKWSGKAWQKLPSGDTSHIFQSEDVYTKLNDKILVINGLGKDISTDEIVFEAYGVINKSTDQSYQMHAYTADGRYTLANIAITDNGFDWWFEIPNRGTIKYNVTLNENTWLEKGHFSPDGNNWYEFFQMELKKH